MDDIKKDIIKRESKKHIKYIAERQVILQKIYNIIGITKTKNFFYSHTIVQNEEMQKQIMLLYDEIPKYFSIGRWAVFVKKDMDKPYMSLIRNIMKEMDVKYSCCSCRLKDDNKKLFNSTIYTLEINNDNI